jgi:hypothetical protein
MRETIHSLAVSLLCTTIAAAQTPAPSPPGRPSLFPATSRVTQIPAASLTADGPPPAVVPRSAGTMGPEQLVEDLITFDDRMVELLWNGGHWQLWSGNDLLKDFGRRESDGRQALTLIRELRLTQRGTVGSPRTIMEYWLADGQAPTTMFPSLRSFPIDQHTLRTERVQGYWCVRDNNQVFFNFGTHQDEAERALAILKKYEFIRLGMIGQGTPTMLVFFGSSPGMTATPLHAPPPPQGRVVSVRRLQDAGQAFADAPPNTLRPSHLQTNGNHVRTTPSGADPASRMNGPTGSDLTAASISFGRQLAPPSAPALDLSVLAERVPLDFRQVRIYHDHRDWKLLCGEYVIANFGPNERDARLAEMAFRTSHFTEQCLVGHPKPAFSYFLVNGKPPRELPVGAQGIAFRPENLSVRQVNGVWAICDLTRTLFVFGDRAEEAKETLKILQKYSFDSYCRLGQGEQGMTILARTKG